MSDLYSNDEVREQAEKIVSDDVYYCVSSLIHGLGQIIHDLNHDQTQRLGVDSDELMELMETVDYEEPVTNWIDDADLSDLESMAAGQRGFEDPDLDDESIAQAVIDGKYLDLNDVLIEHGRQGQQIDAETLATLMFPDSDYGDEFREKSKTEILRAALKAYGEEDSDNWRSMADDMRIEPDRSEVYEHWIVSNWLGRKLTEQGHTVREIFNMTIWGRPTTGQAISMDGVILGIANGMIEARKS